MIFHKTPMKGAHVIELEPFKDERGMFSRLFCKEELEKIGHTGEIVQVNHSVTREKGALRGMHYQRPPHAEIKIVRCIRGAVFDVMVDIRKGSDTFLKWFGVELTRENNKAVYIPQGFAHGFQVLAPDSELLYFHAEFYSPEHEGALCFEDPAVGIEWPLEVTDISGRDRSHPFINESFEGVSL